jgi:hypothetical protein
MLRIEARDFWQLAVLNSSNNISNYSIYNTMTSNAVLYVECLIITFTGSSNVIVISYKLASRTLTFSSAVSLKLKPCSSTTIIATLECYDNTWLLHRAVLNDTMALYWYHWFYSAVYHHFVCLDFFFFLNKIAAYHRRRWQQIVSYMEVPVDSLWCY